MIEVLDSLDRALAAAVDHADSWKRITRDQWRVLLALRDGDGHPMSVVAARAGVPAPTATRLVDALVANTLVYRRSDPLDRRKVLVYLTPAGRGELDAVAVKARDTLSEAIAELGEAGRHLLCALLVPSATNLA